MQLSDFCVGFRPVHHPSLALAFSPRFVGTKGNQGPAAPNKTKHLPFLATPLFLLWASTRHRVALSLGSNTDGPKKVHTTMLNRFQQQLHSADQDLGALPDEPLEKRRWAGLGDGLGLGEGRNRGSGSSLSSPHGSSPVLLRLLVSVLPAGR